MMTCHDCQTNLDDVPVGSPCPNCGSLRRDATVSPETIAATAHVFPTAADVTFEGQPVGLTVSMAVDAVIAQTDPAWRRLEDLATRTTARTVLIHEPGLDGTVLCEVLDEDGKLLAGEIGMDAEDAVLNVADAIAKI